MQPTANHLLVSVPERYIHHHTKGQNGYLIKTVAMTPGLQEQIDAGYGDIPFELDEQAERELVREGQVLALPPDLNEDLYVCAGLGTYPRTGKDIYPVVEIGDTVYLDSGYLTDENEVLPGIYRLPYTAVIATIQCFEELPGEPILCPVGGYALLSRVWPKGTETKFVDGVEHGFITDEKTGLRLSVPRVKNEGVVEHLSVPLGNYSNYVCKLGDRVLFEGYPRLETIRGTEYIVVQQDTIAAVLSSEDDVKMAVLPLDSLHYDA